MFWKKRKTPTWLTELENLEGWSTSTQGYLNMEELCCAQAVVSLVYGQNFRDYRGYVAGNPRKLIADALPYIEERYFNQEKS